ncbi:hypothetical protein X566_19365 [Afipia sp. P52-10]|jgi:hypothetical protein|uniref:GrlR family regulatory protein n=1 Tax=Afipia sp. P52-10 TaxID=1429916 RepID=UPI0003DF2D15|nr:GrlR family regulatory protein [Afipia sp. P52-10]ETR74947.1 hypothetical protein X566_19365 [Afipia sp. P52-10]
MHDGLYYLRVEPAEGGRAANGGIFVLREGKILGGDAFFYYVGRYSVAGDGRWNGEFATQQHTRSELAVPVFGANEVTASFTGRYAAATAEIEATCKAGDAVRGFRIALSRIADA